ncbi:uncharacterized protein LOC132741186 [Ruditapes philippinarum]|uniref:uncharacterized protein LOC132741186 n=1 Tax=Ruditapes philippinarum TaxID=129788 RepID=UPI00295BA0CE|nr:uncharacterized protein LOC132741186 [Ruditapes philippinarum]
MTGDAARFLDYIPYEISSSYSELKRMFTEQFPDTDLTITYKSQFKDRRREFGESITDYAYALRMLGGLGRPGQNGPLYQEELCDRFIDGIGNRDFKNFLKLEMRKMKCPTLDMLVQLATTYESVVGSPDRVRRPSQADGYDSDTDRDRIKYSPQNNYDSRNSVYSNRDSRYRPINYNYRTNDGNRGQNSQIICHKCKEIGHIATRCPLNFQRSR